MIIVVVINVIGIIIIIIAIICSYRYCNNYGFYFFVSSELQESKNYVYDNILF